MPARLLVLLFLAQTNPRTAFEVASVKPAPVGSLHRDVKIDAARVDIGSWSMKQLIMRAYAVWSYQLTGPTWLDSARFDVLAKLPEGATREQIPTMLQALLAERFGLAVHRETRPTDAYALVVAKGGSKMRPAAPGAEIVLDPGGIFDGFAGYGLGPDTPFGLTEFKVQEGWMHLTFTKIPMAAMVQLLGSYLNSPVIDATGLKGGYQASLDFSPADMPGGSLFMAVKQLGLTLERRKSPIEMLIVDHVQQSPKAN